MSDLVPILKLMSIAVVALGIYTTVENYNKIRPDKISTTNNTKLLVNKVSIYDSTRLRLLIIMDYFPYKIAT